MSHPDLIRELIWYAKRYAREAARSLMGQTERTRNSSVALLIPVAVKRPSSMADPPPLTACLRRSHDCCSFSEARSSFPRRSDSSRARLRPLLQESSLAWGPWTENKYQRRSGRHQRICAEKLCLLCTSTVYCIVCAALKTSNLNFILKIV